MKLSKFTVILAILLVSILAMGAVSAETVDDSDIVAVTDGDLLESVDITDAADDLSSADVADETVGDDNSGPDDTVSYDLDDDTYSTYFNEDGTATDALSADGNYYINVGTLTNKDIKIVSGKNIYIEGKEGSGIITNGTITIGEGVANQLDTLQISGITFINSNKNPIVVNQYAKNIGIARNNFDLTYDDTYTDNAIAIITKGLVDEVDIVGNDIKMTSAASYTYGLDLAYYLDWYTAGDANGQHFNVANNDINIHSTAPTGMAEAMYLDSIINSVIEGNNINVVTDNAGVAAYGMQVSDSWGFFNDPWASSPYNVAIKDNTIVLDAADLAYGISAISLYPNDEDNEKIVKDMVISGNDVTITTQTEGVGISASSSDVSITDNKVTLNAGHSPVQAYTDGYIGNVSYGIFVNNFNKDMGNFVNNTVTGNTIVSNVQAINAAKDGDEVQPLTIEDNEASTSYLIDDDSYATYFNADGTIKDDAPISAGDVLLLGDLTGKKLVIDTPLTIRGVPNKKLVNCTIKLIEGADGTVIDGLTIEYPELKYGAITLEEVNNVEITNNKIIVPSTTQTVYGIAINSGTNGCNNISINNNHINITGSKYVYGIDIWQDYSLENKHNNIMIFENEFFVTGTGGKMTEGIFVSNCNDVIIDGNDITATCDGPAYGIGTNYLFNAAIANNHITVGSDNMAYGITATTSGSDLIIRANEIDVVGVGAVGVGINNQTGAIIEDNTISIDGGNYTTITVSDSLGTANAGILVGEGNTDVKTSGNDVSEKTPLRSDTAIEANNITVTAAPSGNGSFEITLRTAGGMPLANQVVKVVFNNQMYELTTDAKGVALLPFALNKGGIYNVEVFYLGDDDYRGSDASAKLTINKIATKTTAAGKTYLATAKTKSLTATLKDANGNVLANKKVTFTVNGKTYTATTNAKGVATVKLALTAAKTYTVTIKFAGDNVYAASTVSAKVKLNKEKTKVTAPKKTFKRSKKVKKVVITLKNSKGKAVAKKKITLTVNKKKYTAKTNKKGKATIKVKLTKKGTFKYKVKFAGDTQYKAAKKNGKIKIK